MYTNCFRDWKSAQNTNFKFVRMDPANGEPFYPHTEVTEFNWIQNLSIHDGIVLDLMLFITSEEVDDFELVDTNLSNSKGPEVPTPGETSTKHTSAHWDRFNNLVGNKPRAYVPLKQLRTKSESLEVLDRIGARLKIEIPNSLLEFEKSSSMDPLEKLNATSLPVCSALDPLERPAIASVLTSQSRPLPLKLAGIFWTIITFRSSWKNWNR